MKNHVKASVGIKCPCDFSLRETHMGVKISYHSLPCRFEISSLFVPRRAAEWRFFVDIIDGKSYDVVVCGAGSAGFCAAVQAARLNMKTAIIEKYAMPGGVMTTLGNNSVDEFNNPYRKSDKMVIQGIGWEFVKELAAMGYAKIPDMDEPCEGITVKFGVKVNAVAAAKLMDDYFLREKIDIYYDQMAVSVECEDDGGRKKVTGVIISTKSGLKKIKAKVFIDCTGDGDICAWAGNEYELGGENGELQPGTLRFYPSENSIKFDGNEKSMFMYNDMRFGDNTNHITRFNAVDSDGKTLREISARNTVFEQFEKVRKKYPQIEFMATAPAVAPRESRRITGDSYMCKDDYVSGKVFHDSVCYSYWFLDIHKDDGPDEIHVIDSGNTPAIRLSSMIPKNLSNVFVAGRCISTDRETNSALRVKASCMAMGQAVGVAAAVAALTNNGNSRGIDIQKVKELLVSHKAIVPGVSQQGVGYEKSGDI